MNANIPEPKAEEKKPNSGEDEAPEISPSEADPGDEEVNSSQGSKDKVCVCVSLCESECMKIVDFRMSLWSKRKLKRRVQRARKVT